MEYTYLFEIGVYRCSPEQFKQEAEQRREKAIQEAPSLWGRIGGPELVEQKIQKYKNDSLMKWFPHVWPYNEAIGWLRLFHLGFPYQLHFEYYVVDYKRIPRVMKKKTFEPYRYQGVDIAIVDLDAEMSSNEIYHEIEQTLASLSHEDPFAGRYFDLKYFYNIGPFIDWHDLLSQLNPY